MLRFIIPAALLVLGGLAVSSQSKKSFPNEYKRKQILFGTGGGFTGIESTYVLQQNGQLFKAISDTSFQELSVIDKQKTKEYFKQLRELDLDEIDLNAPGNLYYFLEEKKREKSHRLIWGANGADVPEGVLELHRTLIQVVRDLNASGATSQPTNDADAVDK